MQKLILFSLGVFLNTLVFAQSAKEKEVAAAIETWRKAMISADKAKLEEITHEKLSYGHSKGKVEDKAAFVEAVVSGKSKFVDITLTEQQISIVDNVAIVRHKLFANTDNAGEGPSTINLSILQVWQNQNNKWILIARQSVKI